MTPIAEHLHRTLVESARGGSRGHHSDGLWYVAWKFGDQRLSGEVKPRVFIFDGIELEEEHRRRGYLTELLARMIEDCRIGNIRFDYICFWNCGDHLLNCLRKAGFTIDDPHRLRVGWRQVFQRDLFDPLEKSATTQK